MRIAKKVKVEKLLVLLSIEIMLLSASDRSISDK